MLPVSRRVRRPVEFRAAVRGTRAGGALLVVHLVDDGSGRPARAGFVVSRAVGGAVERNQVRRRLRHLAAPRLALLSDGTLLVVRALPAAAQASSTRLAAAFDDSLARALRRGAHEPGGVRP